MHPTRSSGAGSGISNTYTPEAAETLRFEEEIQSLMRDNVIQHGLESPPPPVSGGGGSSFTALLGLPPSQAVELLHEVEPRNPPAGRGEMWRNTYPRDPSFVELATRFSFFAVEDPAQSNSGERSPAKPKAEPEDYGDAVICPIPGQSPQRPGKRKDGDRSKAKGGSAKRSRSAEEDTGGEKLPYVHVRARRGQATDSHSLAERARREKINARMKLLQELVPGCSKITGTALVLDEIINHVQSLQRQVEFLSMRLAAVTPRIDFCGLDSFLLAECGRVGAGNGRSGMVMGPPVVWSSDGERQQQAWHGDTMQQGAPAACWERGDNGTITTPHGHGHGHAFINPSLFVYDSHASVSLPNQSKTEF